VSQYITVVDLRSRTHWRQTAADQAPRSQRLVASFHEERSALSARLCSLDSASRDDTRPLPVYVYCPAHSIELYSVPVLSVPVNLIATGLQAPTTCGSGGQFGWSRGAPWAEEQQTRNWRNCTDHHESARQNDYFYLYRAKKLEGSDKKKSGALRRTCTRRVPPTFKYVSVPLNRPDSKHIII